MEHSLPASPPPPDRVLRRSFDGRIFAGVASGVARYFDMDVVVARIVFVTLGLLGIGVPLYLAAWFLVPDEGSDVSVADHLLGHYRADVVHRDGAAVDPTFERSGHGVSA